jgi:hypothetical protein
MRSLKSHDILIVSASGRMSSLYLNNCLLLYSTGTVPPLLSRVSFVKLGRKGGDTPRTVRVG